jgi:hypothetical protein
MEGGQFFFEVTEEEEVAWSKVWALDRMGQALSFRGLNTFWIWLELWERALSRQMKHNLTVFLRLLEAVF